MRFYDFCLLKYILHLHKNWFLRILPLLNRNLTKYILHDIQATIRFQDRRILLITFNSLHLRNFQRLPQTWQLGIRQKINKDLKRLKTDMLHHPKHFQVVLTGRALVHEFGTPDYTSLHPPLAPTQNSNEFVFEDYEYAKTFRMQGRVGKVENFIRRKLIKSQV